MKRYFLTSLFILFTSFCAPQSASFTLRIDTTKADYLIGEPVFLTLTATNVSGKDLLLPYELADWGYGPDFQTLRIEGEDGALVPYAGGIALGPPLDKLGIPFPAGKTWQKTMDLSDAFRDFPKEGKYRIQAIYKSKLPKSYMGVDGKVKGTDHIWQGAVASNTLIIQVEYPKGVNAEAWEYVRKIRAPFRWRMLTREVYEALTEKYPSSIYTAYALAKKYHLDKKREPSSLTPSEVMAMYEKERLKETEKRLVGGEKQIQVRKEFELIARHHTDFVWIDEVYYRLGACYMGEGDYAKAKFFYGEAAKAAKTPELKARAEEFIEALQNPEKQKAAK